MLTPHTYLASSVYAVRLSATERNEIQAAVRKSGLKMSDWGRRALIERARVESGVPLSEPQPDAKRRAWLQDKLQGERVMKAALEGATIDQIVAMALPIRKLHPALNGLARNAAQLGRARQAAESFPTVANLKRLSQCEALVKRYLETVQAAQKFRAGIDAAPALQARQAGDAGGADPNSLPRTHVPDNDSSSSELVVDVGLALGQIQTKG